MGGVRAYPVVNLSADKQIVNAGYAHRASLLSDETTEFHIARQYLAVSYRLKLPETLSASR
jgi:hypothetical protein